MRTKEIIELETKINELQLRLKLLKSLSNNIKTDNIDIRYLSDNECIEIDKLNSIIIEYKDIRDVRYILENNVVMCSYEYDADKLTSKSYNLNLEKMKLLVEAGIWQRK